MLQEVMKKRHDKELTVLINRISKDKNQQLRHRKIDSERMLARDKNIMKDILLKHSIE